MKTRTIVNGLAILTVLTFGPRLRGQFLPEDIAERARWEEFLETAEIVGEVQMTGREAVTSPWRIALKKGDIERNALWKDAEGRMGGYIEGWRFEIAAYRLDKLLELGRVPPTIERRLHEKRGSCMLWIDGCITLTQKEDRKLRTPPVYLLAWNRGTYLQRAFDNLIANEDRHMNQLLVTQPDFRQILIDHSRSFRTSKKFTQQLIYTAKSREGPRIMKELPRAFVERLKALTAETIRAAVGEYLRDDEIAAVLARRDLILAEIDRLVQENGESQVLY